MDKTGEESENISEAEQYIGIWKELDTFHLGPQRFVANGPRLISSNRVTASLWRQHSRCEFSTLIYSRRITTHTLKLAEKERPTLAARVSTAGHGGGRQSHPAPSESDNWGQQRPLTITAGSGTKRAATLGVPRRPRSCCHHCPRAATRAVGRNETPRLQQAPQEARTGSTDHGRYTREGNSIRRGQLVNQLIPKTLRDLMSSQQPEQAQPHPRTILRGHKAQVHAAVFIRNNERLVTGDAEGYVVLWDLAIMRPRAVWRAHDNSILGLSEWRRDRLITHGRDNKLIAWKLSADDESALGVLLPLDLSPTDMKQPWMLHLLEVNTMNFCSFASCPADYRLSIREADELLVAVPNTLATEAVDIFHLPSQQRKQTLKPETGNSQDGMVMALSMFHKTENLTLCVGYENGLAAVVRERIPGSWTTVYVSTPHTQPILSLDAAPDRSYFFTSGADATIAKHPIPDDILNSSNRVVLIKAANTKHAGQQSLRLRDDGRIFATGGWDGMVRVYSARTAKELAVLKWHKTGCYAVAFANVLRGEAESGSGSNTLSKGHIKDSPSSETSKNDGSGAILSTTGSAVASHDHTVVQKLVEVTVKEKRERAAVETHWVAAGGKDGKVSLWDIY